MILLSSHDAGAGDGRWSEHAAPARLALPAEDRAPRDDGGHAERDTPVDIPVKDEPSEQAGEIRLRGSAGVRAPDESVGFPEITPYADNSMTKYQPLGTMDRYRSSAVFMELRL